MTERLLTINDVADRLNVRVGAIYELRRTRKAPPAIKLGRSLRWRQSDIDAWLAEQFDAAN